MHIENGFFHVNYCNYREYSEVGQYHARITRRIKDHELILINGIQGSIKIAGKRYRLKDGSLIYLHPDVVHTVELDTKEVDTKEPYCLLSVHFDYVQLNFDEKQWSISDRVDKLCFEYCQELKGYYQVERVFKGLLKSWEEKLPGYEFVCRTLLQQLFIKISDNLNKQQQNYSSTLKVEEIIKYMHQNIDCKIKLAEVAELVQLSPAYLSKEFKETTGYTLIKFFNKMKIDKAKELLIEDNRKVKEVANALGFTDEFYFSRVFKEITGSSPLEFYNKKIHGF